MYFRLSVKNQPYYIFLIIILFLFGACDTDSEEKGNTKPITNNGTEIDIYDIPCSAVAGLNLQLSNLDYASQYAQDIMLQACIIGGVPIPSGGMYQCQGINNAFYIPKDRAVIYDPDWLYYFFINTGFVESGDSILFHEIGHHWSFLTGRQEEIMNTSTNEVDYNWKSEYTADSFAGYVLRSLNGNATPSVEIYLVVMGNWSHSHPPSNIRAQVFYNSWYYQTVQDYRNVPPVTGITRKASKPIQTALLTDNDNYEESQLAAVQRLKVLAVICETLLKYGENPFSPNSDITFNELISDVR